MKRIVTVLGDRIPGELGFCQSHEHLYIARGYPAQVHPDQCIDDPRKSAAELALYKKAGGAAVVDAQPVGCGRDAQVLERISKQSGVHVIASTGFHKMLFYPRGHWVFSLSCAELARIYTAELTCGMYVACDDAPPRNQTAIRAGQIKTALDERAFTGQYLKMFEAASRAAAETEAPMMVHIEKGSDPVALADFLQERGVDTKRTIFCHMDRSVSDIGVHREICARGIYMEYDTVARPKYHDDQREIEILRELLSAGYENQVLMSLDVTRARLHSYGRGPGLVYILEKFLPLLRRGGIGEAQIWKIFTENPACVFAYRQA